MTERILVFFALVALGWAVRRWGLLSGEGVRNLLRLNQDVCLPALVFATAAENLTPEVAGLHRGFGGPLLGLPLAAVLVCVAGWALARITARLAGVSRRRAGTYAYCLSFANASFLPIPLSYALHGELGPLYVSLFLLGYLPLAWTWGTSMLSGRPRLEFVLHPVVIGLGLGAAAGMTGTRMPSLVLEVAVPLGASAIPLALVYVGAILAEKPLAVGAEARPLAAVVILKLVALPALALAVTRWLPIPEPIASQAVLQAAMPCMAQAGLYAARFGGDAGFGSKASFATTLACLATVPFVLARLGTP